MSAGAEVHLSQIGQIALTVRDLKRMVAFYRDTLGMKFLFEAPPRMAFFDVGGVRLLLGQEDKANPAHPASILYYKVADIRATFETLVGRGVTVAEKPALVAKMPDHDLWLALLRDPEGNAFALMSEVARA
ncbi:MAG TPA: VOC family protein [Candidatus Xenobia bacterium]|nr:VOC family protein [Candidatus Xenobia bacterium]